jgi:hypothetical protein
MLPELGAYRLYVADGEWKDRVQQLIARSTLVVLRLGQSSGVWWEFECACQLKSPRQLILYIEPPRRLSAQEQSVVPFEFPKRISKARFVWFDHDWRPRYARSLLGMTCRKGIYRPNKDAIMNWALVSVVAAILYFIFRP